MSVHVADLRSYVAQKLAIKRMNLQASKEFMAELQVLTHVHHTNLVRIPLNHFWCCRSCSYATFLK